MRDWTYSEDKGLMRKNNGERAIYNLKKANDLLQQAARAVQIALDENRAVQNDLVPSQRFEPTTIHGNLPSQWFFNPVNCGNCHDCPLESCGSYSRDYVNRCGAQTCIVRQLCELEGLVAPIR